MGGTNNKSNKEFNEEKTNFKDRTNSKYSNNNYNYGDIIFILLIFDQIFQFIDDTDKKDLFFCNKKSYQLYCNYVTKLKIDKNAKKLKIVNVLNKYKNMEYLEINECNDISFLDTNSNIKSLILSEKEKEHLKIKDLTPITKLDKSEILDISIFVDISNISFLKYVQNLKELHLNFYSQKYIEDSSLIFHF